jgi:DNA polymerase V
VRAQGSSMRDAGIADGDLLVVDRALEAKNNNVVIAVVNGEFTVKRFVKKGEKAFLLPENRSYKPIEITGDIDFTVWGVVTNVIHDV